MPHYRWGVVLWRRVPGNGYHTAVRRDPKGGVRPGRVGRSWARSLFGRQCLPGAGDFLAGSGGFPDLP